MAGGMGFHPDPLVPKHLVALSESDVVEILEAFNETERAPWKEDAYVTSGGPALKRMLNELPQLYAEDKASSVDTLTERGEQALVRMVAGVELGHTLDLLMPGTTPEQQEEFKAALREQRLADALLEVSLAEGKPGPERSAIVDRHTAAQERLRVAALEYGKAAMREGEASE